MLGIFSSCLGDSPVHTVEVQAAVIRPCPPRHIRVSFDPLFADRYRELGGYSLPYLIPLGVTSEIVDTNPDVRVTYWMGHTCDGRMGLFALGTNYVKIDPACIFSDLQFQAVVAHEIAHWLGMTHVCDASGATSDTCSTIGRGSALLNPFLAWDHPADITNLDIQEYNRVCWFGTNGSSVLTGRMR